VADNPDQEISLKSFHCKIVNDHAALKAEANSYTSIPQIAKVDKLLVQKNYEQIKQDVQDIIESEMQRILNNSALKNLVIEK